MKEPGEDKGKFNQEFSAAKLRSSTCVFVCMAWWGGEESKGEKREKKIDRQADRYAL